MPLWPEKRWQFMAVVGDEGIVAAAIANLGYLGLGFAYAYDRRLDRKAHFEVKVPLGLGAAPALEPDGAAWFAAPLGLINLAPDRLWLRAWELEADFALAPAEPLDASWQVPTGGPHRTRKRMGGRAKGLARLHGDPFPLEGAVLSDWSRGQLARETSWLWVAGAGTVITPEGPRTLAWNLRTGFDDPTETENALWVGEQPQRLGAAAIAPGEGAAPWAIAVDDLTLSFHMEGEQREDVNLGMVASRYRQPWGRFTGSWRGQPVEGYGVVEQHWAKW